MQCCQMAYLQTKKSEFGYILEGLAMQDVWYILRPFGPFYGHLVYFVNFIIIWYIFHVLVCCNKKIWQPWIPTLVWNWVFLIHRLISYKAPPHLCEQAYANPLLSNKMTSYFCNFVCTYILSGYRHLHDFCLNAFLFARLSKFLNRFS
jgi:hypothetical protein